MSFLVCVFYDSVLGCLPGQLLYLKGIKHYNGNFKHKEQIKAHASLSLPYTNTHTQPHTLSQDTT